MQREVIDAAQCTWTCVQAYAGLGETTASQAAAERVETERGDIPVVCTPAGGAQSVRIELPSRWTELPEADLLAAIARARTARAIDGEAGGG